MDECLDEYIDTAEESLTLLRKLVDDIEAHHSKCNIAKTAGTAASVLGSAVTIGAIAAAPFTGGASIIALGGYGAATAIGGAVTKLGTDAVDMIWTKSYQEELIAIDSRLEDVGKRFSSYLEQIEAEAAQIFKENGNEEEAYEEAFKVLITTGKIGWKGKQVLSIAKNMGQTTGSTFLRNGGEAWKGMQVNSNLLTSAFQKMGLDVSQRAALNVVKGATAALSAIFIVWDLKSLAYSLNNDHPAAGPVKEQIEKIEKLFKNLKDLRDSFNVEEND
ncbi:hypothetical protein I4U23_027458 [Adineta vaga]|nr:hypothetical protein I4U23_027458 [Adineta vaga]